MKLSFRPLGLCLLLGCALSASAQNVTGPKIDRVDIKFVGPASVSEQYVRANIKLKVGDIYRSNNTQDDVHTLYATGQFYNIRVAVDQADDGGVNLTYVVQARPRVSEIKIVGNKKLSDSKLKKKITLKVGDPLDEQKLFTDVQEMKKMYEKYGRPDTQVKYIQDIDEGAGRAVVTFQIVEAQKIKIRNIAFIGASAFTQKQLRGEVNTSQRRWWKFSWLTSSGYLKQDDLDSDRDKLVDFYRSHGYLDFEIKDVKIDHPLTNWIDIKYFIFEGRQYKVGSVKFSGNKLFTEAQIEDGLRYVHNFEQKKGKVGPHGLVMDVGDTFSPDGLSKDSEAVQDFYGSKGYIEMSQGQGLRVVRVPNVDTGTMDLEFQIDEGQKSYVEKIDIRGNLKTKDKVIRRELAISPGEVLDMVRVKISKQRLEGLQYFDKVDMRPEPTDPPIAGRKDLIVNVEEQSTGNFTMGAGYSSVDALVGYVEVAQGNFDLFHPPTFTGGGQKIRLRVQLGTVRQDYELSFIEPWFLNRKLSLGVDLYRHDLNFESPNTIYDEARTGMRVSLTRALWTDFFIGSVSYTIEDIGIRLNPPYHGTIESGFPPIPQGRNVPQAILDETGDHFYQRVAGSLAYDTRNSTRLPNHGQRTEVSVELSGGDRTYYKLELKSAWYFPGLFHGDVIEVVGHAKTAESLGSGDVPFYDRYYLGGMYTLRGFRYRNIAPREPLDPQLSVPDEPIGGDSSLFGSVEYSIPILEKDNGLGVRIAAFYDIGSVAVKPYSINQIYDDNWGLGFRLNIPHLGPLRLDYGVPIHHDQYNSGAGQFQFGVGYERPF